MYLKLREDRPTEQEMIALLGDDLYTVWQQLAKMIEEHYTMAPCYHSGGKQWVYECKYRKGGKTLCALYAREKTLGFMVIFGQQERNIFEQNRKQYSQEIKTVYDQAPTYHDGKWMMFLITDTSLFRELLALLRIKRKPN